MTSHVLRSSPGPGFLVLIGLFLGAEASLLMAQDKTEEGNTPTPPAILKTFRDEFVSITPGKGPFPKSFEMGSREGNASEQPRHRVQFDYEFRMAKYEVPQNVYEAVMGKNPSVWGGPRNSVEMVTFREAEAFCAKATQLLREAKLIAADEVVRLPSEAEWEYCCRAGTNTAYCFGDEAQAAGDEDRKATRLDKFAWHTGNAAGNDPPVGVLKPNAWGLYDMHGYLWEYVSDSWHADYENAPGDGGSWQPNQGEQPRVIRGGSWRDPFGLLTSATRWPVPDHAKSDAIGFRCVLAKK